MNGKAFIDTNIFVYSFDDQQPEKQERSRAIIQEALEFGTGMISTQVIQEFLNVATRKFAVPMKLEDCRAYLRRVLNPLCQVYPDLSLYETCLAIMSETHYALYDSLILAAAVQGDCSILYSEDLQAGQTVRNLKIQNPFK